MAELGEMFDAGVRVFSDDGRCVPNARVPERAHVRERVRGRGDRGALRGRLAGRGRTDARGVRLLLARARGATPRSRGGGGRPGSRRREADGRPTAPVPPVLGGLGRDGASGQGRGAAGHRGGDTAPPRVRRGGPRHLRHQHEDEPAAALGRDRSALRAALADGTIDVVATDHAPHAVEEKEAEFDQAPFGTIGLETALAALLTHLVEPGELTLSRAIEAMSTTPARILGAHDHGGPIAPGRPANLVAFDPPPGGPSSHRSPRRAGTRPSSAVSCAARSCTRCSEASSSWPTGRRSGGEARPRSWCWRTAASSAARRSARRGGLRRGGLQHGDVRVPGGAHGSLVRRAGGGDDRSGAGQLRHERAGRRVRPRPRVRVRGPRGSPARLELASHGLARRRAGARRSSASRASTRAG